MGQNNEEHSGGGQANNPLANMTALNFHNYYIPKLTDAPEGAYLNSAWIRFAKPLDNGKFIFRLSAPLSTVALPNQNGIVNAENGLGDINALFAYSFVSKPTATLGVGPVVTAPTATEDVLGTGKWQTGVAFVAFLVKSKVFQTGGLVIWQMSVAGDDDRPDTHNAAVQPFYFFQLGKGTYLRGSPIWYFDIENDSYSVPMGIGIGKVIPLGKTVVNMFMEPQYTLLHNGIQPQFQLFAGINFQFMK